jgi:small subunit ribosomal protein S17
MAKKKTDEQDAQVETPAEESSIVDNVIDTVAAAAETVAEVVTTGAAAIADAVTGGTGDAVKKKFGKRAEKIGVGASDKMTKTVVVRVDRLVKHPIYRKYVRKRKKFMAHDEMGAKIGDKVRIVETRPMSAHKRWRVVEIIQKAEL